MFFRFIFALILGSAMVVGGPAGSPDGRAEVPAPAILTPLNTVVFAPFSDCGTCSCCSQTCTTHYVGGGVSYMAHSTCWPPNCHQVAHPSCGPEFTIYTVDEIWDVAVDGQPALLSEVLDDYAEHVVLNRERQSLQILGCDRGLIANIPVPREVVELVVQKQR